MPFLDYLVPCSLQSQIPAPKLARRGTDHLLRSSWRSDECLPPCLALSRQDASFVPCAGWFLGFGDGWARIGKILVPLHPSKCQWEIEVSILKTFLYLVMHKFKVDQALIWTHETKTGSEWLASGFRATTSFCQQISLHSDTWALCPRTCKRCARLRFEKGNWRCGVSLDWTIYPPGFIKRSSLGKSCQWRFEWENHGGFSIATVITGGYVVFAKLSGLGLRPP